MDERMMEMESRYDVIVIGGGHAGCEAASAAARLGARCLLITPDLSRVGQMSCNPAIGGVAKGTVAREVDALGGVMGRATDASRIQFRMLNRSKGPAVWGPRAQCDRGLYTRAVRRILDDTSGLDLFQDLVTGLLMREDGVEGVRTRGGLTFRAGSVVVTAGTFLRGRIHVGGAEGIGAGRAGEGPSVELAEELEARGLEVGRFKTGTPPRVDGRTVDFDRLEVQHGDPEDFRFSFYHRETVPDQRPCWITWTGEGLRRVVEESLERSALYGGEISGRGPRYCPSIEDKVVRFPDAPRHQVFLEPEGLETTELYVNGLSTSLPADVQIRFLHTVPGLEEARVTKLGYAIEYDYFPPHQLRHTLELKEIPGLFFAGQINGTTGYEEAAGQGIVAGANAGLKALGRDPFVLDRDEAYIGVMIDDLVTKGVDEPYRLFTSRAEFRLLLRQDNAAVRLGPRAREVGLLTPEQEEALAERIRGRDRVLEWFRETALQPSEVNPLLEGADTGTIEEPTRARELLKRPELEAASLARAGDAPFLEREDEALEILAAVQVEVKYEGYVARETERARKLREQADFRLDEDTPYREFATLSVEAREKLTKVRPTSLAQAGRIPGVSPADLQNLMMEVRRSRAQSRNGTPSRG
ncbi:MAG: tRNA uridine-5-carboxymethylaminomethyl(34) synthesis enzyme MnmG [Longimicrobiales bacterium]|nr:tRNA uridine-5-carboxymethylaminomethyl(34) synthesis enzyme MnmG [Longimicrobiales bacterium]